MSKFLKQLSILALLLALPLVASADPNAYLKIGTGDTPLLMSRTGYALTVGSQGGNGLLIRVNGANLEKISQTPAVPTMAATPVAGTNEFSPGLNIIPTAAANTAALLGPSTPVPGQRFTINNNSGATVRIKAAGGATLNGATAGGYITIVSLATVNCFTASLTNQVCMQPVIPTPQGP